MTAHPAEFSRYAKALASGRTRHEAITAAVAERASPRVVEALKAASPSAALTDPAWGGSLAPSAGEMSLALIESIRPRSVFYSMAARAVPADFHARGVALALIAADEHTESEWLPVHTGTLEPETLEPVAVGSIIVVSTELARSTTPASFNALRRELEQGAIRSTDTKALSIALEDVTPTASTADPLADLRALLAAVSVTGAADLLFVAAPDTATSAATASTQDGARIFPMMGPTGGEILGVPCIVSDAAAPGTLALFDASGFAANEGAISVDRSEGAALQMRTDPAQAAATMVPLFQNHLIALRVISAFGLRRMRDTATAVLTGIPAAWTPEAE